MTSVHWRTERSVSLPAVTESQPQTLGGEEQARKEEARPRYYTGEDLDTNHQYWQNSSVIRLLDCKIPSSLI